MRKQRPDLESASASYEMFFEFIGQPLARKDKNERRSVMPHKRRHDKKSKALLRAKLRRIDRQNHPRNEG